MFLYKEGNDIVGRVGSGSPISADPGGAEAFRVSVDAVTGEVTLDQELSLAHPNQADPNDAISLDAMVIYLQADLTDNDGDKATKTLDLSSAISFLDDAPTGFTVDSAGYAATLVLEDNEIGSETISFDAGNDDLPSLTFNITSGDAVETISDQAVKYVEPGGSTQYILTWSTNSDNSILYANYTDNLGDIQTALTLSLNSSTGIFAADVSEGSFLTVGGFVNFANSDGTLPSGGNNDYFGLTNISGSQTDVIASASDGNIKTTVNTNAAVFGAGNNFLNAATGKGQSTTDQSLVFEFYSNSVTSGSTDQLEFDSDNDGFADVGATPTTNLINNFQFTMTSVSNDGDARAKVEVRINGVWSDYTTDANDGSGTLYDPYDTNGNPTDYVVNVSNSQDYEAIRITSVTEQTDGTGTQQDGGAFKVTVNGLGTLEPVEDDIPLEIPITLTDGDGDTISGTIAFGIDKDNDGVDFNAPIVLDLGNAGIQYVSVDNGVNFSSGVNDSINTAWVTPEDGLLVIDANNSGTIDHLNEFVFTEWSNSAATDMEAVHEVFDTNKNYYLDDQDFYFDLFYVWQDLNSDGVSDQNELLSLRDLGIEKIGLNYIADSQSRSDADGDVLVFGQSKVYFEDGTTTIAEDAAFRFTENQPQQLSESIITIAEIENVESANIHDVILKIEDPELEREISSLLSVDVAEGKIVLHFDPDSAVLEGLSQNVDAFVWIETVDVNGNSVLEDVILEVSSDGIYEVTNTSDLTVDPITIDSNVVASLSELASTNLGVEESDISDLGDDYDTLISHHMDAITTDEAH